jgi:TRAP transporter TAXI family solute receptor
MDTQKNSRHTWGLSYIVIGAFAIGAALSVSTIPSTVSAQDMPKNATWSGSALGGAHYRFGAILAQVLKKELNVSVTVEGTGGPWQNVALANTGKTDLIPVPSALGFEAYTGKGKAKGKKHQNLRVLLPMFPQYLQWWALPGGITSFKQLSGKHVDMSGPGSFLNDYGRKLFDMFGVKPSRITNLTNFGDSNTMLVDGQLDAAAAWSGIPAPPAAQMITTRKAHLVGVPKADAAKFSKKFPGVYPGNIPANTYKNQTEPLETLHLWTFAMTRKDLSEEFAYKLVKAAFENQSDLVAGFKAAKNTKAENIKFAPLPVHKGAARYYREKGIELPPAARPID